MTDSQTKKVNTDANYLIRAATEMFVEHLAGRGGDLLVRDQRKMLRYRDIGTHRLYVALVSLI